MNNITIKSGNIFNTTKEIIVIPVNCAGIMGKGLALQLKHKFPSAYYTYKTACMNNKLELGRPYLYNRIIFFPTKTHWRAKANIKGIEVGLNWLLKNYKKLKIQSIAFPALGCGEGHLKWSDIIRLMYRYLAKLDIDTEIYQPL